MKVAIAGSTGYSGQELKALLAHHGTFRVTKLISREDRPENLKGVAELVFLCTPVETSLEWAPKLLEQGIHVVDVSGAFRLKKHSFLEWYGLDHPAKKWLDGAEYGLAPFAQIPSFKEKPGARLISNPGCFATAIALALIPLIQSRLIDTAHLCVDAKSGTTGAGRKAETRLLFSEVYGDFLPYRVGRHQHWPEIVEAVSNYAQADIHPILVTSLLPVARGISATVFSSWKSASPDRFKSLHQCFEKAYGQQSDIRVTTHGEGLSMKTVVNTNRAHIELCEAYGQPVIFCAIDNLLRGAAGQALMNANLLAGLHPNHGLTTEGLSS